MPTRLPIIDAQNASDEQAVAIDEFSSARGGTVALGELYGMTLNSAEACPRLSALGAHCRYGTRLSPQLTEAAILGAVHGMEFEYEVRAHQAVARAAGMSDEQLSSLAAGTARVSPMSCGWRRRSLVTPSVARCLTAFSRTRGRCSHRRPWSTSRWSRGITPPSGLSPARSRLAPGAEFPSIFRSSAQ